MYAPAQCDESTLERSLADLAGIGLIESSRQESTELHNVHERFRMKSCAPQISVRPKENCFLSDMEG